MRKCVSCGEEFSPEGRQRQCDKCKASASAPKGPQKRREKNPKTPKTPKAPKKTHPSIPGADGNVLTIDMSQNPDVFNNLVTQAQDSFRTPELQALYLLNEAIGGS